MPHYKRMYDDKEFLYAFDLDGRDVTLTIEKVMAGEVSGEKGRKSKKPVVKFAGKDKRLALNKTNGKTIAKLYGTDTDQWIGRLVTLYPTTTDFGGETVECIRVRPNVPEPRAKQQAGRGAPQRQAQQQVVQSASDAPPPDEQAEILAAETRSES